MMRMRMMMMMMCCIECLVTWMKWMRWKFDVVNGSLRRPRLQTPTHQRHCSNSGSVNLQSRWFRVNCTRLL